MSTVVVTGASMGIGRAIARAWAAAESGVTLVLLFLDEVIRLGHTGKDGILLKAREAGQKYLRDVLLPQWSRDGIWGYHFWDWDNPVNAIPIHHFAAGYLMNHPEVFPAWRTDVRNIVSLFLCRSSVDRISSGGVYSGSWASPESTGCCGQSLQYPTQALAAALARYAVTADSPWARELARRQALLTTYDATETGVVEDNIDGGQIVAGAWFNLSHPWPLKYTMESMSWLPEILGPNRENHVMRTSSVVRNVQYGKGRIAYSTFDADSPLVDVLRLAFFPTAITAGGKPLEERQKLDANGYCVRRLSNGDAIVSVRQREGCAVNGGDFAGELVDCLAGDVEDRCQSAGGVDGKDMVAATTQQGIVTDGEFANRRRGRRRLRLKR